MVHYLEMSISSPVGNADLYIHLPPTAVRSTLPAIAELGATLSGAAVAMTRIAQRIIRLQRLPRSSQPDDRCGGRMALVSISKIQRRATKLIPELRDLTYEERLKECGLTTLETRRLRGDQIEVFKILNGYENIDSNIFFEIKESKITRGHNYTLVKKQSRLDVRKFSFSQRTINIWNNLSTDCVHASSVNMFKNKIDKYLVKAGYT